MGIVVSLALLVLASGCPHPHAEDPKRSSTRLELAKDYLRRGQLDQAEEQAHQALHYDDQNVEAYNLLGLVQFVRAENNFRLLEIDDCLTGVDAEALRSEMDEYLTRADKQFQRAVQIQPHYGEGWFNRGNVALELEDYGPAIAYLSKALTFPHTLINIGLTRANLGWAYFHKNDQPRAAKELRQAAQFNPGMCVAKYRLGRVYFARKEWNKALEQFQAVAQNNACPMQEAHLYLAKTYAALGMNDQLSRAQAGCLQMAPKSCIAARCRAVAPAANAAAPAKAAVSRPQTTGQAVPGSDQ